MKWLFFSTVDNDNSTDLDSYRNGKANLCDGRGCRAFPIDDKRNGSDSTPPAFCNDRKNRQN